MKKFVALILGSVAMSLQAATYNIAAGDVADLSAKLLAANNGDEIVLAKGTYYLSATVSNTVGKAVTLRGATGNRDDVILDGQNLVRCVKLVGNPKYGNNRWVPEDSSKSVYLKDLTIRNGANNSVIDCLSFGKTIMGGGGAFVHYGFVDNCAFTNCHVVSVAEDLHASSGGLYARIVKITNSLFEDCSVTAAGNALGGAVAGVNLGNGENYQLCDVVIRRCSATATGKSGANHTAMGGGAFTYGTTFTNCVFDSCITTNTVGLDGYYYSSGAGVYFSSFDASLVNCVFTNCFAHGGGGGVWMNNEKLLTATNCTFVGCGANRGGAVWSSGSLTADSCLFKTNMVKYLAVVCVVRDTKVNGSAFIDNISYGSACVFWTGVENLDKIATKYVTEIKDSVFDGNASLINANGNDLAGVLSIGNFEATIDRCVFTGNKMSVYPNSYYNRGGTAIYLQRSATNVVVRNCYFTANSGSPMVMCCNGTQRFSATTSYLFESCTFADNSVTSGKGYKNLVASKSTAVWPYFNFRNNCFTNNTGINDGLFASSFVDNYGSQITYNAADTTTGFPAGPNNNIQIARLRDCKNKGHNETWMTDAADCGDGTYMLTKSGDYGVKVTFNNANKRIINDIVDVGAQELKASGAVVIFR